MKRFLIYILAVFALLGGSACKSKKSTTTQQQPEPEAAAWQNVSMPVSLELTEPMTMTINGTATMVRGEYVLVSVRFFGFEVGSLCLTPQELDVVLKQPDKIWLSEPVGKRFASRRMDFTNLQEALLGDKNAIAALPPDLKVDFSDRGNHPSFYAKVVRNGKTMAARLTLDLSSATWDANAPRRFAAPSSGYKRVDLNSLLKQLK